MYYISVLVCLWKWKWCMVSLKCYFMLSQQEICFITHQVGMMFYMFLRSHEFLTKREFLSVSFSRERERERERVRERVVHERTTNVPSLQYFNMWTVSSDVSIQRRHWQPLSVHLRAYCTNPTRDVNDVTCEGWPQHRGLRPLLFSNSGVGSLTSHKNQISVSAMRRDLRFFVLIRED